MEDLGVFLRKCRIDKVPAVWYKNWENALKMYPLWRLPCLENQYLLRMVALFALPDDFRDAMLRAAEKIRNDPELSRFFWLWHYILFVIKDYGRDEVYEWPEMFGAMGKLEGMFSAIVLFSGYEGLEALYWNKGIPLGVIQANKSDVRASTEYYREKYNFPGLGTHMLGWTIGYLSGNLYEIGTLRFELCRYQSNFHVYRNNLSGKVVALCGRGLAVRSDGQLNGTNGIFDKKRWITRLNDQDEVVTGNPVSPEGYIVREKISLIKKDWQLVLLKDDDVLNVHIPERRGLNYEDYNQAFGEAISFFQKYFPEKTFKALVCYSWLLSSRLGLFLDHNSNIIKFQRCFYRFPVVSDEKNFYRFLFKCDRRKPEFLPANTSLQKAVREFLIGGGRLWENGGFILNKDLWRGFHGKNVG
jgi:hypothetical protein